MDNIGERIKKIRKERGMSQQELADKCGYKSRSSINKIEKERDVPIWRVIPIAEALGVTPDYIAGWEYSDDVFLNEIASLNFSTEQKKRIIEYAKFLIATNESK